MFRRVFIVLLAIAFIGFSGLVATAQTTEDFILDVGVAGNFYQEKASSLSLRADLEPFGLPTVIELYPEATGDGRVILNKVNLGFKYPEPFDLRGTYIGAKSGLTFSESQDVAFNFGKLDIFAGTAFEINEFNLRVRPEFGVKDFLDPDNRLYRGTLTLQYVF